MQLRDHGKPCDHQKQDLPEVWGDGYHTGHPFQYAPAHSAWCPGGELVDAVPVRWCATHVRQLTAEHVDRSIATCKLEEPQRVYRIEGVG